MRLKPKLKGSSLTSVLIFGFAVLATASAISYVTKTDLTSIKSLISKDNTDRINQLIIKRNSQMSSETELQIDQDHLGEKIFGDYKSINTIIKTSPSFYLNNTNIELYHAEPLYITYNISHKLLYKDTVKQTSNLVLNKLPKHSMIAYQDNLIPINVPYISTGRMNPEQKSYHLNNSSIIIDSQRGYVGYIDKSDKLLRFSIGENTEELDISSLKLDKDYSLKLGWNLENGHWILLIAVYDKKKIDVLKTSLTNLVNHSSQATIDLSNNIKVNHSFKNISQVAWYNSAKDTDPQLIILDKEKKESFLINTKESLSIYSTNYKDNSIKGSKPNTYTVNEISKINLDNLNKENNYVISLDLDSNLNANDVLIFESNMLYFLKTDVNNQKLKTVGILNNIPDSAPLVVKKNEHQVYIITHNNDTYQQYVYTLGTSVLNQLYAVEFRNEEIKKIIAKYGVLFIFTNKNIYINDFDAKQFNKIKV